MSTKDLRTPSTSVIQAAQERLLDRLRAAPYFDDTIFAKEDDCQPQFWPSADEGPSGERRYEFAEVFASGGLGVIRRAYDRRLGRVVAVKELQQTDAESIRRFVREAVITARLQHPAIVPLYDIGRHEDGEPYYCMKLIDGTSLDRLIDEKELLSERLSLVEHVRAAADAIAYAHQNRVIHRDLKPANILIGKLGETVVIDWGLAKDLTCNSIETTENETPVVTSDGELTETGAVMGTLRYMPPEQAQGHTVDERSDVFALGAVLFHVLTGKVPYSGAKGPTLLQRVSQVELEDLDLMVPETPELNAIVSKAMTLEPGGRYPTAAEFAEDLRRYLNGLFVGAHEYTVREVIGRWFRRYRGTAIAGVLSLISFSTVAILAVDNIKTERDRAAEALVALSESEAIAKENEADAQNSALRASYEAKEAQKLSLTLLKDAGRRALDAGRPHEALGALLTAYEQAPDDTVVKSMVADAMRPADSLRFSLPPEPDGVRNVHVSSSLPRFLTVSGEGVNRLWDTSTGELIDTLVTSYTSGFFEKGEKIAAIDSEGTVHIYESESGAEVGTWNFSSDPRVTYSHLVSNASLVIEVGESTLRLFEVATGKLISTHLKHSSVLPLFVNVHSSEYNDAWAIQDRWSLLFGRGTSRGTRLRLPKSRRIVELGIFSGQAIHEDTRWLKGNNRHSIYMQGSDVVRLENCGGFRDETGANDFLFTDDGALLIGSDDEGGLAIWRTSDGRCEKTGSGDSVIHISGFKNRFVTGGSDGTLALWSYSPSNHSDSPTSGEFARSYISPWPGGVSRSVGFRAHSVAISTVEWTHDGSAVITAGVDGEVSVWEVGEDYSHELISERSRFWPSPRGHSIAKDKKGGEDGLQVLSLPSLTSVIDEIPVTGVVSDVEWIDDQIMFISTRSQVEVWNTNDKVRVGWIDPDLPSGQEISGAWPLDKVGETVLLTSKRFDFIKPTMSIWNWKSGIHHMSIKLSSPFGGARLWLGQANRRLLGGDGALYCYPEMSSCGRTEKWPVFSPERQYILTRSTRDELRLHDGLTGGVLEELRGEGLNIQGRFGFHEPAVFFTSEGDRFLAPRNDGVVEVWSYPGSTLRYTLEGHSSRIRHAKFTEDDHYVLTFGDDKVNWLWDLESGVPIMSFRPNGDSWGAEFSHHGDILAVVEGDELLLVDLESGTRRASYAALEVQDVFFSPTDDKVYTIHRNGTLRVTPIGLEHRSPDEVRRISASVFPHVLN